MSQQTESVLNRVLIDMGRSFLQYISDAWPWVDPLAQSLQDQVMVIAARQRQDVGDIAALLTQREHYTDFGTFPTEYTDLQFLSLDKTLDYVGQSQASICDSIASGLTATKAAGDEAATALLLAVEIRQKEATSALSELHDQLSKTTAG